MKRGTCTWTFSKSYSIKKIKLEGGLGSLSLQTVMTQGGGGVQKCGKHANLILEHYFICQFGCNDWLIQLEQCYRYLLHRILEDQCSAYSGFIARVLINTLVILYTNFRRGGVLPKNTNFQSLIQFCKVILTISKGSTVQNGGAEFRS